MARLLYLLAVVALARSDDDVLSHRATYDGFRAKFGWSSALEDKEYFYNLPRSISLAEGGGWRRVERPPGSLLPELRMFCRPDDVNVCPLFDQSGFVAGIQIAIPAEAIHNVPEDPTSMFMRWKDVSVAGTTKDYWTSSLFFVSEESMKRGAGPTAAGVGTLQDVSIWAFDPTASDKLMRIPLRESELNKTTEFKKQNCIPNMGTHYYYKMSPELPCDKLFPWFALVKDGNIIGAGFQTIGHATKTGNIDWFEEPVARSIEVAAPSAPECAAKLTAAHGLISLHIYFVDKPWNIKCVEGDSLQSLSVVNKLLLNVSRYGSKIVDEAKKLFSG